MRKLVSVIIVAFVFIFNSLYASSSYDSSYDNYIRSSESYIRGSADSHHSKIYLDFDYESWDRADIKSVKDAANQGDSVASFFLGLKYYLNIDVFQDYDKAEEWILKSAKKGNIDAQVFLGELYKHFYKKREYDIVKKAPEVYDKYAKGHIYWLERAARYGSVEAQNHLGDFYIFEAEDYRKAKHWLSLLAEQNPSDMNTSELLSYSNGIYNIARIYNEGLAGNIDYDKAGRFYKMSNESTRKLVEERGITSASIGWKIENILVELYFNAKDYEQSKYWFNIIEKGYQRFENIHKLGVIHYKEKNYSEAKKFFEIVDDISLMPSGEDDQWFYLGEIYYFGNGVKPDYHLAKNHYERSYEYNENSKSQVRLGELYMEGKGARQDTKKALKLYLEASKQENPDAQLKLGRYYKKRDTNKAKEWFGRACDNGSQEGCDTYREMNM